MATHFVNYMSWNIENLSKRKMMKTMFSSVTVPFWIAKLIEDDLTQMLGVMEITLGTGEAGAALVNSALGVGWNYIVSDRSVPKSSKVFRRADKYAIFWQSAKVTIANAAIDDKGVGFQDRLPMYWEASNTGGTAKCLLWHAPQPKNHLKDKTIANLAKLIKKIDSSSSVHFLASGDFNYSTASSSVYKPLTDLGFDGVFDGERTSLSSVKKFISDKANRDQMVIDEEYEDAFLSSAYDNVFLKNLDFDHERKIVLPVVILEEIHGTTSFFTVPSLQTQTAMKNAKILSDHMPVSLTVYVP